MTVPRGLHQSSASPATRPPRVVAHRAQRKQRPRCGRTTACTASSQFRSDGTFCGRWCATRARDARRGPPRGQRRPSARSARIAPTFSSSTCGPKRAKTPRACIPRTTSSGWSKRSTRRRRRSRDSSTCHSLTCCTWSRPSRPPRRTARRRRKCGRTSGRPRSERRMRWTTSCGAGRAMPSRRSRRRPPSTSTRPCATTPCGSARLLRSTIIVVSIAFFSTRPLDRRGRPRRRTATGATTAAA
mmetsp:Transcript_14196/g.56590  ORF Transcript_14196/g.56590 Transcript_14196/m.56590 type:complete len:243 (-) Transcript_14196:315-1043(-)